MGMISSCGRPVMADAVEHEHGLALWPGLHYAGELGPGPRSWPPCWPAVESATRRARSSGARSRRGKAPLMARGGQEHGAVGGAPRRAHTRRPMGLRGPGGPCPPPESSTVACGWAARTAATLARSFLSTPWPRRRWPPAGAAAGAPAGQSPAGASTPALLGVEGFAPAALFDPGGHLASAPQPSFRPGARARVPPGRRPRRLGR